jgi:hypothetical protein
MRTHAAGSGTIGVTLRLPYRPRSCCGWPDRVVPTLNGMLDVPDLNLVLLLRLLLLSLTLRLNAFLSGLATKVLLTSQSGAPVPVAVFRESV